MGYSFRLTARVLLKKPTKPPTNPPPNHNESNLKMQKKQQQQNKFKQDLNTQEISKYRN